jgi:hypothetical protein
MAKVDTQTPILHLFHQKCKKWCLGVWDKYTAIVFGKTPLDTNIRFFHYLTKGGVYFD